MRFFDSGVGSCGVDMATSAKRGRLSPDASSPLANPPEVYQVHGRAQPPCLALPSSSPPWNRVKCLLPWPHRGHAMLPVRLRSCIPATALFFLLMLIVVAVPPRPEAMANEGTANLN